MYQGFKGLVIRVLKIPPEPHPPAGQNLEVFRAASAWFNYRRIQWFLTTFLQTVLSMIGLVVMAVAVDEQPATEVVLVRVASVLLVVGLVALALFRYATLRIDYEMRWYMVTDRSLRLREGVFGLREMTLTFANIQEISIRQGPIQRLFGVKDVLVRTAGGGAAAPEGLTTFHMHIGYLRGVDNAEAIRDLIRRRLEAYKDAGLGDDDDNSASEAPVTLVAALAELQMETRALRDVVVAP